jgi:hypothetical protein
MSSSDAKESINASNCQAVLNRKILLKESFLKEILSQGQNFFCTHRIISSKFLIYFIRLSIICERKYDQLTSWKISVWDAIINSSGQENPSRLRNSKKTYRIQNHPVPTAYNLSLLLVVIFSPWAILGRTRAQSVDRYGSGTLHPGQVLRGSLPLLSPVII